MEQNDPTKQRALAHDLADLQRLIRYLQRRRAELTTAAGGACGAVGHRLLSAKSAGSGRRRAGGAFDRRAVDATNLLKKLWTGALNLRLQGIRR